MKKYMKKFFVCFAILVVSFFLANLIANQIFDAISPHNSALDITVETPITALKERCNSCFRENSTDDVCTDDFLNVIDTEDEAGNAQVFAVYYRQYKDLDTNVFLLVPDKETEQSWFSYLKKVRSKTAKEAELYQYNFSLQENTIWITSSSREA